MDIWQYVALEGIELPSVYFSHRRRVFRRDGMLMAESPYLQTMDGEAVFEDESLCPCRDGSGLTMGHKHHAQDGP